MRVPEQREPTRVRRESPWIRLYGLEWSDIIGHGGDGLLYIRVLSFNINAEVVA